MRFDSTKLVKKVETTNDKAFLFTIIALKKAQLVKIH